MTTGTQTWSIRPPRIEDVSAVVSLLNTCALADYGASNTDVQRLQAEWEDPTLVLEEECRLAGTQDGRALGFAEVWNVAEGEAQNLQAYVHIAPDCSDLALPRQLWDWAEARACQEYTRTQSTHPHILRTKVAETDRHAAKVLQARGYRLIRHSWRMTIDLDADHQAPHWPEGISVRTFVRGQDEPAVFAARNEGSEDMWGYTPVPFEPWEYHLIQANALFDPSLWFLAVEGKEIVGICLCQSQIEDDPHMAEIKSVMMRRNWRRRGIATALLRHAFTELVRRSIPKAGLSVDAESLTGANRVYEKVGMKVARQYDRWEKDLAC